MATRTITTTIALDGEQKFKQQMSEVNRELRNLKSEMGLVEETFRGQANSVEALTAKGELLRREVEQQEEKVRALEGALKEATDAYGETDKRTDDFRQSLNRAQRDLLQMNRELEDTDRYLDEARRSADGAASSIDEFGREVAQVDLSKGMGIDDFIGKLGSLKNTLIGGVIVGAGKELIDVMGEVVSASEEYRKAMGTLESGGEAQGYSIEETKELYRELYAVMGDTQGAAEAAAQLQTLQLGQANLSRATEGVIGMWVKLGQSAPIESLSEAVSQTISAGTATGAFADYLVAAGISEDEFNAKLQESKTYGDRVAAVLDLMASEKLPETAEAWRQNNEDIVQMNESTGKMDEAMGLLGETLAPLAADMQSFGADVISGVVVPAIQTAITEAKKFNDQMRKMREEARSAGTSLTGQGFNFDFMDTAAQVDTGTASLNKTMDAVKVATSEDVRQAAAAVVNYSPYGMSRAAAQPAVVQLTLNDGRVLAETLLPDLRALDKSDPEAVNDG